MSTAPASTSLLANYQWPSLPESINATPRWDGDGFHVRPGEPKQAVLTYEKTDSHWSEELTELHETEAGNGEHPIDQASRTLALRSLRRYLPSLQGIILDVGCSSGFFLHDLRRQMPDTAVIGADYIAGPLHKLAGTLAGVPLLQFDLRNCPLPTNSLAGIVCLNVLEHIDRDSRPLGTCIASSSPAASPMSRFRPGLPATIFTTNT
jgi:SAM-dependent methyltransferase